MMKRILPAAAVFLLVFGIVCGTWGNTLAKETGTERAVYYTSIEISEGDSLWSVAHQYAPALGLSTQEYIDCLKQMNHLRNDTIHAGCHLTVMYGADAD